MKLKHLLSAVGLAALLAVPASAQITNVNTGTTPNDGTGDPLRSAFLKLNYSMGWVFSNSIATNETRGVMVSNTLNLFTGTYWGNGIHLTNLSASNLAGQIAAITLGTGTTNANTLLHGNSAWSQVSLAADVTGTLPIANGGSGATSATAAAFAFSAAFTNQPNNFSGLQMFNGQATFSSQINSTLGGIQWFTGFTTNYSANCIIAFLGGGSGSGIGVTICGTNNTGGLGVVTNAGGFNWYNNDTAGAALSIAGIPTTAIVSDLPGTCLFVVNGETIALASSSIPGGVHAGNYSFMQMVASNSATYFPQWSDSQFYAAHTIIGGSNFPTAASNLITSFAMIIHHDTGNVVITNNLTVGALIKAGTSNVQITIPGGAINTAVLDNNSGTVFWGNKTVQGSAFQALQGSGSPDITTDSSGDGIGEHAGSGGLSLFGLGSGGGGDMEAAYVDNSHFGGGNIFRIKYQTTFSSNVVAQATVQIQSGGVLHSGTGSPAGAVTGSVGDLFLRTDGGTSTTLYVKETGTASTSGWVAK